jgi:hypothetical protein
METTYRLLTENEKEYILNFCQDRENRPAVYKRPLPYVLLCLAIGALVGCVVGLLLENTSYFDYHVSSSIQGVIAGVVVFLYCMLLVFSGKTDIYKAFRSIPEAVLKDQMKAEEATYVDRNVRKSGLHSFTWLHFQERDYLLDNLFLCEQPVKDERYIILLNQGRKWVFRARE